MHLFYLILFCKFELHHPGVAHNEIQNWDSFDKNYKWTEILFPYWVITFCMREREREREWHLGTQMEHIHFSICWSNKNWSVNWKLFWSILFGWFYLTGNILIAWIAFCLSYFSVCWLYLFILLNKRVIFVVVGWLFLIKFLFVFFLWERL